MVDLGVGIYPRTMPVFKADSAEQINDLRENAAELATALVPDGAHGQQPAADWDLQGLLAHAHLCKHSPEPSPLGCGLTSGLPCLHFGWFCPSLAILCH